MGSREDAPVRINQEEGENFAVAWFCRVFKLERLDLVLENVWESEKSSFLAAYTSNVLDFRVPILTPKYLGQPFVVVLLVLDVYFAINFRPECKATFRDIFAVIVV